MSTEQSWLQQRRTVVATSVAAALVLSSATLRSAIGKESAEDWVSPPEDLMREHGVLDRLLLIYEASATVIEGGAPTPGAVQGAADLIRRFIEDYHERLEEQHVFPRFEKAGKHADLVRVLREQHQSGRRVTAEITRLAAGTSDADRNGLRTAIGAFVRMYRPHAAREDTVLFPAFRGVVSAKEFHELGESFEDEEHRRFGKAGFEGVVDEVAAIERTLGIEDLSRFTPKR
jgi:hemerythrin-like domain-containing protein